MVKVLEFGAVTREPDIRYAKDMASVILDQEWYEENKEAELYYMYRDLWKKGDREKILNNKLRYDITIIPSRKIGKEHVKTKGHYHPESSTGIRYPEIYEVLNGTAHYLLQKKTSKGVEDVVLIEAEKGQKALIPPDYGHITINPSNKDLKMANWVNRDFESIYGDMIDLEGGAYFELVTGEFIKNEKYDRVPEVRQIDPIEIPEFGITTGVDMYDLIKEPENLEFLTNPKKYMSIFPF
ncbi:hypothetical protein AKJ50_01995 [candidate division MSBL1 archaeon SCGC-AAA382A13]|uniref:glucose-6-phosphate isomerase n=1 Tax=candidate division MSBL1 archaeon SCGC-AAA382A13 TaxID=1698279 RepID=A0A133VEE6_9EURY|nr:hypothetical protein AKJ50_01995 [candidate division MSBL1 archaeon SCGC-AAA382A13]